MADEDLPLVGLKVLDLSRVLAGPLCSMILGDLGAHVVKIERPGTGDETRGWGPPFDDRGQSAYYLSINRNKLSVAADLRSAPDHDLVLELAASADVVVENFLPGALERAGIELEKLLAVNPKLVWCSITGFGAQSSRPGYDFVVQAESGWMSITGEPAGDPMKSGIALADIVAGKDAAIAILAALARPHRSTAARRIVISLIDSARAALVNVAQNAMVSGNDARRWGNAHANLVPYQLFGASDRPIVIAVGSDEQWLSCARVLGLAELADDVSLRTNRGRLSQRARVVDGMQRVLRSRSAAHWIAVLHDVGVPSGVVQTVAEAVRGAATASPLFGLASSVGGRARLAPPRLDEHGALVREHGWNAFGRLSAQAGNETYRG